MKQTCDAGWEVEVKVNCVQQHLVRFYTVWLRKDILGRNFPPDFELLERQAFETIPFLQVLDDRGEYGRAASADFVVGRWIEYT